MKIGVLVKEFPPDVIGGTETQTYRMATELERRTEHDVVVYTKAYGETGPDDEIFDVVRVPNLRISPFVSTLTFVALATLYLLRDSRRLDVLQCMMVYPNGFVGYVVSLLTGLPYFAWIRGGDYYFMKDVRVKRWMIDRVFRDTLVLVQTEAIREDVIREFPHAALSVLGNGVTIPDETADGDATVFVGRLKRQKGVHVLLRAMQGTGERLLLVGEGPERERLERLAAKLGVDAEFTGEVDPHNVGEYLTRAGVFVLPSVRGEGLPNAVLEAMAFGIPVVATDTGGVINVIEDGETGFVVEPGSETELRERITYLHENPRMKKRMGENARRYVEENHSWTSIIRRLSAMFEDQASGSRSGNND